MKIHRSILDWQWWPDDNMLRLWLYLIITANIEDRKWRNITVRRGQIVTTYPELAVKTGLSYKNVRTCLDRLEDSGEIGRQTTNKFTIITVCKFDTYQVINSEVRQAKGQTKGTQKADKGQAAESSPRTPFKDKQECKKIYYYSSSRTREEQQEKQFFYIFRLKGSADPREEYENFLTWNTTPERAAAWDRCPEYARYSAARRWTVKGRKMEGYTDDAGRAFTALVDEFIRKCPDFPLYFFDGERYPATVKGSKMTLFCKLAGIERIEDDVGLAKKVLRRFGITKLDYVQTDINQNS